MRSTILLVDDEKKFLNTISEKIRLKGFEPLSALSGEEAIKIAKGMKIDIAIVDHKMPGMGGIATITKLKEIHPDIRTVLLTGYGNEKVKAFWSTGKVGMTGTSYNGTLPVAAATTGVKGLEAIIPIAPGSPFSDRRCRSIQALASPWALACTWS